MLTDTLRRVADQLIRLPYKTWSFGDSVGFEGMVAASQALADERWLRFAHGFVRAWATRAEPYVRLDCTAPGLAMIQIYRATEDSLVKDGALGLARYLVTRPRIEGVFATWAHSPLQHPYGPDTLSPAEQALVANPPAGNGDCDAHPGLCRSGRAGRAVDPRRPVGRAARPTKISRASRGIGTPTA